jgi:hypothetical protein
MFWRLAARRRSLPSSDAWARRSRHRCSAAAAAASIRQVNPCLTAHVSPCMRHRRSRCRVSPFATIHSVRGVTCSRSSSSPVPSVTTFVRAASRCSSAPPSPEERGASSWPTHRSSAAAPEQSSGEVVASHGTMWGG